MADRYGIYAAKLNTDIIGGITDESLSLNPAVVADALSGEMYPRFVSMVSQRPLGSFVSKDISSALMILGTAGQYVTAGNLFYFYFQKWAQGVTRSSGSVHRCFLINKGFVLPRRLSGRDGGDATLSVDVVTLYDGANDIVNITDNNALPSITSAAGHYAFHKAIIGGVTLDADTGVDIDFGLAALLENTQSSIWPQWGSVAGQVATIVITSKNIQALKSTNIPLAGKAATHANTAIYFKKRKLGGTFEDDSSPVHFSITAAGMANIEGAFSASGQGTGDLGVKLTTVFDGTNALLELNPYATIP